MVYRVFVEKKPGTSPESGSLLADCRSFLGLSRLEDLRILVATMKILFMPESTDGVAEGQTTAMDNEKKDKSTEEKGKMDEKMMVGSGR